MRSIRKPTIANLHNTEPAEPEMAQRDSRNQIQRWSWREENYPSSKIRCTKRKEKKAIIYTATLPGKLQATKSSLTSDSPISFVRFICSLSRSLLPIVGARLIRLTTLLELIKSSSRLSSRRIRTPFLSGVRFPPTVTVETLLSLDPERVRR